LPKVTARSGRVKNFTDNLLTEKAFMDSIVQLARQTGWLVYHTHDSRRSEPGFPDLVMTKVKRLVIAEIKTEKGKTSPAQDQWLSTLRTARGVKVKLWRPSDWPEIERTLGAITQDSTKIRGT
tara:strand:- start:335 stop:703 length:369 start_codon:yes stop_codon:yes gene_type:complete